MSALTNEQLLDVLRWLASRDTGISSKAMVFAATTGAPSESWGFGYPHDLADLGRCLRMCKRLPWVFDRAKPVLRAEGGPVWVAMLDRWDELAASMDEEVGIDWSKGKRAARTYALMESIRKGASA